MKLIIATPFYEMKAFSPYVTSLVQSLMILQRLGIAYDYWDLSGDSYVDRARNTICERFLESDGTDLLMIDSDMAWDPVGFVNILKSPFEVTGAAYPCKNNWENYGVQIQTFEDGAPQVNIETGLIRADWVPAGFLRIKKSCLQKYKNSGVAKMYCDRSADPMCADRTFTSFFECSVDKGARFGEDVTFCKRWRSIGGEIWVEPRITIRHYGIKEWEGNYDTYLRKLPGRPDGQIGGFQMKIEESLNLPFDVLKVGT
jgi:hypothetical protein